MSVDPHLSPTVGCFQPSLLETTSQLCLTSDSGGRNSVLVFMTVLHTVSAVFCVFSSVPFYAPWASGFHWSLTLLIHFSA